MYRSRLDPDISRKMTRRNLIRAFAHRFYSIIFEKKDKIIKLTFVLIRSKRNSFSSYWKILIAHHDLVVDVTREIGIILEYDMCNEYVLKESSYGISVPEDICRKLEIAFSDVIKEKVHIDYTYFNASLED